MSQIQQEDQKIEKRRAVVVGATGLVGRACVRALLDHKDFERIILWLRSPFGETHPKLEVRPLDFNDFFSCAEDLSRADVFCCLGTTMKKAKSKEEFERIDFEIPRKIARLAVHKGAQSFNLVSARGANPSSPIFYFKVKGALEHEVLELPLARLNIFRPGLLVGKRTDFRAGEYLAGLVLKTLKPFLPNTSGLIPTDAKELAAAMIREAQRETLGKKVFESPSLSHEISQSLS